MATGGSDDFLRLESLVYRRISPRPDWLKAWRNEANYILFCARRAEDTDDVELLEREEAQPAVHVLVVHRATDGLVRLVHSAVDVNLLTKDSQNIIIRIMSIC